ncbi:MAG: alpha/beta hydrolase [Nocardioides sp.]
MRRVAVAIALLVVVVLVAGAGIVVAQHGNDSAGAAGGPTPVAPSTGAPPTQAPEAGLARFYDQKIDWSECSNGHQCAKLKVPLDYAHPGKRTIELALLKVPASGKRIGSLVVNPGGPGEPGTSFAALGPGQFGEPLLQHFDIVGFDPRGTGASAPVDCLSDQALNAYLGQDPEPSTPAEVASYVRAQRALAAGCSRLSGALAGHVSTVEAARDMDVLRAALGESTLNYLGSSYGTKLGATYAQLFPHRVGRFVLDGAVDPTLGTLASSVQQAGGFQRALDAYAANCIASSGGCFLGKTVPEVEQKISDLLDQLAQHPLPAGNRELTAGNAFYGVAVTLYSKAYWVLLSNALRMALSGDGTGLMVLADAYAARSSDGTFANNSMEAFVDISCLDDPYAVPASQVPSHYPAFEKASPVFGKVFAWALTSCNGFRPRAEEKPPVIHAKGAAPIVVIGTTRDPATPYPWAVHLARVLDSGVLVTRNGDGHTGYHTGNACIDDLVHSYLVSGVVPSNGTRC